MSTEVEGKPRNIILLTTENCLELDYIIIKHKNSHNFGHNIELFVNL